MEDGAHGVLTAGALRKGDEFAIIRNRKEVVGHAAEDHNKNKPAQRRLAVSLIPWPYQCRNILTHYKILLQKIYCNNIVIIFLLDPCEKCKGDSNRCVNGKCICGDTNDVCPETTPVCSGDGKNAKCVCNSKSCEEPNPVCSPDGTCKVK